MPTTWHLGATLLVSALHRHRNYMSRQSTLSAAAAASAIGSANDDRVPCSALVNSAAGFERGCPQGFAGSPCRQKCFSTPLASQLLLGCMDTVGSCWNLHSASGQGSSSGNVIIAGLRCALPPFHKVTVPESRQKLQAWQADHDAYGFAGQKCSAQSMLFMHERHGEF